MNNNFLQCVLCDTYYGESAFDFYGVAIKKVEHDHVCRDAKCPGQGIQGLCLPVEDDQEDSDILANLKGITLDEAYNIIKGVTPVNIPLPPMPMPIEQRNVRALGLCVFLMDASGSMGENVFGDYKQQSVYNNDAEVKNHANSSDVEKQGFMSKREMMASQAALGIFSLHQIKDKANAYVSIILYDHSQKYLFFKSVEKITTEYSDAPTLAKYLLLQMKDMNGATNITGALGMAHNLVNEFRQGTVSALGSYEPYAQTVAHYYDVSTGTKLPNFTMIPNVPNTRVLLYTDGAHLSEYGVLDSPFQETAAPDLLIGIYVGQRGGEGERELRSIIRKCPIHGEPQYMVVDNPKATKGLYGIFRMATGASGFCPKCIATAGPTNDK